jgi:exonuclease III
MKNEAPEADFISKESSEKVEIELEHLEPGTDMLTVLQFNINGLNALKEELLKIVKTKTLSFIEIQKLRTESENTREKERKALSNMDYNIIYYINVALIYHKSFKLINKQIKDKAGRITGGLFQKEKSFI